MLDHAPLLSVAEAQSHHGAVALHMATGNFTAVCSDSDDLLVIEADREVMYNSCVHGHAPQPADVVRKLTPVRANSGRLPSISNTYMYISSALLLCSV